MKVLSIDWDYFQMVSKEQLSYYPDGIDLGRELSEIVWSGHYEAYPGLTDIAVNETEYRLVHELISRQEQNIPVMIANSHALAYGFILDNLYPGEKVVLTNIDMHQDIVNDNEKLDCGNWIGHLLINGYVTKPSNKSGRHSLTWIHNPVSFKAYGMDNLTGDWGEVISAIDGGTTIDPLLESQYDLIFIAQSDTWSPPHLDPYFCKLVWHCKNHFSTVCVEEGIDSPRRITPIKIDRRNNHEKRSKSNHV